MKITKPKIQFIIQPVFSVVKIPGKTLNFCSEQCFLLAYILWYHLIKRKCFWLNKRFDIFYRIRPSNQCKWWYFQRTLRNVLDMQV